MQNNHPRILVVNDDPASLLALSSLLSHGDEDNTYEIMTARSGEEALRQVLRNEFAVILLDVDMPGMDGFETAEAIHQRPRSAAVPIIFVTAYLADEMNRLKGYQKGAVDYLFTPIIPQILQAKVAVFVALARKNLELKRQTEILNERSTELSAANQRLQLEIEERKAAERQSKAKDEFLAMLGHELRNPLSAISSAASVLGLEAAHNSRAVGIIQRQSQHLSHIVDDLLDLSRVMSRKIMLSKQAIDLATLLANCVDTLRASGRLDAHELQISSEAIWIDADPTRIEQIIINLLDNALKYTPQQGGIHISLRAVGEHVELQVADSGVGIAPELLPHVFDVFVQGKRSLDRSAGGLGIGLALVRQLVELHDGSICADSDGMGRGSIFTVKLPRIEAQALPDAPVEEAGSMQTHTILIIDDNEDGLEMMTMLLMSYGFNILKAGDGLEGLALAQREKPDIALVDIGLPGIDGYEVARRLRAGPETATMRLIALTGYGLEDDVRRAIEAGFDLHMVKPVDVDQLVHAVTARLESVGNA